METAFIKPRNISYLLFSEQKPKKGKILNKTTSIHSKRTIAENCIIEDCEVGKNLMIFS